MMDARKLGIRALSLLPYCLVAVAFGSVWPAVTLLLARYAATLLTAGTALAVIVVRLSPVDRMALDLISDGDLINRALRSMLTVPALLAHHAIRAWLVWMLSAPSYAVEMLAFILVLSTLQLGRVAIFGMPPLPPRFADRA